MENLISISSSTCVNCGRCEAICPSVIFGQGEKIPTLRHINNCIVCGHCVAICPTNSVVHNSFPAEKVHAIDPLQLPEPEKVLTLIRARRSNRAFTNQQVSLENLKLIVEAGYRAPTATNAQQVHFTVVTSADKLKEISQFTIDTLLASIKLLKNPLLKPILKKMMPGVFRYIPIFERMDAEMKRGNDMVLRGAKAAIFIHTPASMNFGKEDSNLAYQNCSLMAESLGVAQFYTGFVCAASARTKHRKLAQILGTEDVVYAGMALGMSKYQFAKYIDKKDVVVHYI